MSCLAGRSLSSLLNFYILLLFVEKRHCPRDPGIVLSRQVCTNNTVIHKSSGRIAYDLYRICDFAHSLDTIPGVAPLYRTWKTQPHTQRHGDTETYRHRDTDTQTHRDTEEPQKHNRITETQPNRPGQVTSPPLTPNPTPFAHPFCRPSAATHFTPHPSHPTHVRQSLNLI